MVVRCSGVVTRSCQQVRDEWVGAVLSRSNRGACHRQSHCLAAPGPAIRSVTDPGADIRPTIRLRSGRVTRLTADVLRVDRLHLGDIFCAADDGATVGEDGQQKVVYRQTQQEAILCDRPDAF